MSVLSVLSEGVRADGLDPDTRALLDFLTRNGPATYGPSRRGLGFEVTPLAEGGAGDARPAGAGCASGREGVTGGRQNVWRGMRGDRCWVSKLFANTGISRARARKFATFDCRGKRLHRAPNVCDIHACFAPALLPPKRFKPFLSCSEEPGARVHRVTRHDGVKRIRRAVAKAQTPVFHPGRLFQFERRRIVHAVAQRPSKHHGGLKISFILLPLRSVFWVLLRSRRRWSIGLDAYDCPCRAHHKRSKD